MPGEILIAVPLILVGFGLLLFGGELLVAGASTLARRLGVSELVVGLTVVAFGTSMPELVVSVTASATGENAVSIGNVVGSNICNIGLILGLAAVLRPVFASPGTVWKEIPFLLVASVTFAIMASDIARSGTPHAKVLSRGDGLVLLVLFSLFLYYMAQAIRHTPPDATEANAHQRQPARAAPPLVRVVTGLLFLILGGQLVVTSAVDLAAAAGVSERIIGLTIIATGTSLPELSATLVAAYRKNAEIALGTIVGSNIFNTLFILGVSATVAPLPVASSFIADAAVMLGLTLALFTFMFTGRGPWQVQRAEGAILILGYLAYLGWLTLSG